MGAGIYLLKQTSKGVSVEAGSILLSPFLGICGDRALGLKGKDLLRFSPRLNGLDGTCGTVKC
jgi:hypothetical protein